MATLREIAAAITAMPDVLQSLPIETFVQLESALRGYRNGECQQCGRPLPTNDESGRKVRNDRKFCSEKCKALAFRERQDKENEARDEYLKKNRNGSHLPCGDSEESATHQPGMIFTDKGPGARSAE